MALILNIETATKVCSVSIANGGQLIALKEQDGEYSHSENLTVFIQEVCQQAKISLHDLDAISVSKGPGSYTGLRIGVSTAKGLCYALNTPLIAINTLQHTSLSVSERLKSNADECAEFSTSTLYCPMLDARRMEVYCAVYDFSGKEVLPTTAKIIDEHAFNELLKTNEVIFFGEGSTKCKASLSSNKNASFIDAVRPSSKNMISLSEIAFEAQNFEDIANFEPYYLKDFMATKPKAKK